MKKNDSEKLINPGGELVPVDDFLIVELDDRLEFGVPLIDGKVFNEPTNGHGCTSNTSC